MKFLSPDFQVVSNPLPRSAYRLFFPYIAGDLYGPATTGDFIHPTLNADLTFDIDFGRAQQDLTRELQPTEFSLDYLKIDPAEARIARLAPLALQPDGIDQVASADWIDGITHERLMLVYVDRPCRITGVLVRNEYTIRYNVRASTAGYIWIARHQTDDGELMYTRSRETGDRLSGAHARSAGGSAAGACESCLTAGSRYRPPESCFTSSYRYSCPVKNDFTLTRSSFPCARTSNMSEASPLCP